MSEKGNEIVVAGVVPEGVLLRRPDRFPGDEFLIPIARRKGLRDKLRGAVAKLATIRLGPRDNVIDVYNVHRPETSDFYPNDR